MARREPPSAPNFHGCIVPEAVSLPYCDHTLSIDARLADLLGRLTLDEKIGLISPAGHTPTLSEGVPRLGLPGYNWLTEANTVIQAACVAPNAISISAKRSLLIIWSLEVFRPGCRATSADSCMGEAIELASCTLRGT